MSRRLGGAAWLALLAACATGRERAGGPGPGLVDADLLARAERVFAAHDRDDLAALERLLAPGFLHVDQARVFDRAFTLERARARGARGAPRTRSCKDAQARAGNGVAVYVAECTVSMPGQGGRPPTEWVGLETLVWGAQAPEQLVLWTWQKAGLEGEREMWNEVYRKAVGFSQAPNRLLMETVGPLAPGTALDLMMGQGRNALHLASRGWKVTGVDLSDEGVGLARAVAAERGLALEAVVADVDRYELGTDRWDLVTMIYAGADRGHLERARAAVKPGGLFLLEYFAAGTATGASLGGVNRGELARVFAGWTILRDEVVDDVADWGADRTLLARFVARKPGAR